MPGLPDDGLQARRGGRHGVPKQRKRAGLVGRRESLARGWALTVTGPDATEALAAAIMARIKWQFDPSWSEGQSSEEADLQRAMRDGRAGGQERQAGGMGE